MNRNPLALIAFVLAAALAPQPAAGQDSEPDGFCLRPASEATCRTFAVVETSFPLVSDNGRVSVTSDWKLGLLANVAPRSAVGAAVTLVGSDTDHYYSGVELRYRHWLTDVVAADAAVGGDWLRPHRSFVGTKQFQTQARLGLWIGDFFGVAGRGSSREGSQRLAGGPQFGSWLGLALGAVMTGWYIGR